MSDSTAVQNQTCPKCGEGNPAAAVMCWACYSPLQDAKLGPIQMGADQPLLHFPQPSEWRDRAEKVAPFVLAGALISSGWWRSTLRFGVLGVTVSIIALIAAREKYVGNRGKHENADSRDLGSPICRIADTILIFAIRDNASQVRISRPERAVHVEYLVDDEWQEQMHIPLYVWRSLLNEILMRSETGCVQVSALGARSHESTLAWSSTEQDTGFSARILIEPPHAEILLTRL